MTLWRSGLDADGLQAMLTTLTFSGNSVQLAGHNNIAPESLTDLLFARLSNDDLIETILRYGRAVNKIVWLEESNVWAQQAVSNLLAPLLGAEFENVLIPSPPPGTSEKMIRRVAQLIMQVLRTPGRRPITDKMLLRLLFDLPSVFEIDPRGIAAAVIVQPSLVEAVPELRNSKVYGNYFELMRQIGIPGLGLIKDMSSQGDPQAANDAKTSAQRTDPWPAEIQTAVRKLLLDYVGPSNAGNVLQDTSMRGLPNTELGRLIVSRPEDFVELVVEKPDGFQMAIDVI